VTYIDHIQITALLARQITRLISKTQAANQRQPRWTIL